MKSLTTLAAMTALALAGCVPKDDPAATAEEAVNALPTSETLNVAVPGAAGKVGDVAASYLLTRAVAGVLNGEAAIVLGLAKTITEFPVTSVENDTLIWGPWSEALNPGEYRMTVKVQDGKYAWTIEGRAKGSSDGFQAIVSGLATPGRPHRGSGNFTFDCDVAHAIDPFGGCDDGGQASVTYDLEHVPATITVDAEHLAPMPDGSQALQTFHYQYSVNADGSGQLSFMQFGDTDDPGPAWETTTYDSKWLATGAGRTDISVTGGDVGSVVVTATECWDTSFLQTYFTVSAGWLPTVGSPAGCSL